MTSPTPDSPADAPHANEPGSASQTLAEAGRDLRDQAESKASEIRDAATGHVRARAESAREDLAGEVSSVGKALRRASEELRSGSPQERVFGQMATSLAEVADSISGRDVPQLIDDLEAFGRRNPMAFLGGAALLGFAGVRMARASRKHPGDQDLSGDHGHSGEHGHSGDYGSSAVGAARTGAGAANPSPSPVPASSSAGASPSPSPSPSPASSETSHMPASQPIKEGQSND